MEIVVEQMGNSHIIRLSGRLDGASMSAVESKFLQMIEAGHKHFIFDLHQLEYISSAGLRVMLLSVKKTKAVGGKVAICGLNGNIQEVFDISGFSSIFSIFAGLEDAVQHMES